MTTSREISELQERLTDLALEAARDYDVVLDFGDASIDSVEEVLGELHRFYREEETEEGLHGLALGFAAYIVTTIERNHGAGEWRRDHPELGENTFPYHWRGSALFPYAWCLKRIVDGAEDDVRAKYRALVLEREGQDPAE